MYWPFLVNIINTIFNGATVITALLLLLMLFRVTISFIDKRVLVRAINCTLLLGAATYILAFILEIVIAYFSQIEYEQYAITNRMFAPYWYVCVIQLLGIYVLPQLVWIKRFRRSIIITVVILLFYKLSALFDFIAIYFFAKSSWAIRISWTYVEFLEQLVVYLAILSVMYFVISKRDGGIRNLEIT